LAAQNASSGGKYCKDHTRNRFCTKLASSLYFIVGELAGQQKINIFHKNREISILTIKKKTARLTLLQEATERTRQGETQNKTKHKKHTAV
jgi:hypothetical protein